MSHKKVDPRVKRTRQMLVDGLVRLLETKDLNKITIQNITDEAALTRATFYLHYQDKVDFLNRSMLEIMDELVEYVQQGNQLSLTSDAVSSFERLFEFISQHRRYFRVMMSDRGIPGFSYRVQQVVKESVYGHLIGEVETNIRLPKEIVMSYITGAHISVIRTWLENDMIQSPKYMAKTLTAMTIEGVLPSIKNGPDA